MVMTKVRSPYHLIQDWYNNIRAIDSRHDGIAPVYSSTRAANIGVDDDSSSVDLVMMTASTSSFFFFLVVVVGCFDSFYGFIDGNSSGLRPPMSFL
jgi:hypothetical protein